MVMALLLGSCQNDDKPQFKLQQFVPDEEFSLAQVVRCNVLKISDIAERSGGGCPKSN